MLTMSPAVFIPEPDGRYSVLFPDFDCATCGDDLNDLAAMAVCGFVTCPADAAAEVKARADYQCPQRGGEGAVRGAVEHILRTDGRWHDAVKAAFHVDV